jgi:hypothetical protein
MMQKNFIACFFILLAIAFVGCAKRGNITGGSKDTLAPVLISSFPKNGTVNFNGTEIKLYFDEYVKLKNVGKQLIVSPPMKKAPEVLPYNASKFITIKLKDTLQPNTTYSLNFGQSIADNNEGNVLPQFKYVFSTGSYIDSLALSATFKDAKEKKMPNFVSIMMYEVNEKYNDSTIYKETPRYITNSLDSLKLLKLENLKQGKYRLIALKDANNNNKFDPKLDKIGFIKDFVTIPNDTIFELKLFKEALPFKLSKLQDKDSVQIWFKPMKNDSIVISASKDKFSKDFVLKLKDQKNDTLSFTPQKSGNIPFREKFAINSTIPLEKIDNSKISIINKDKKNVAFTTLYDEWKQQLVFDFEKQPIEKYTMTVLPGALVDFYERKNDSLKYSFATQNTSDFANLRVKLKNIKRFPVIVELTDKEGKILASGYSEKEDLFFFDLIEPNKFTLRVIYDDNKNKIWDPGNYLEKRQSEEVIYCPEEIDVRANWDWEQTFDIGK